MSQILPPGRSSSQEQSTAVINTKAELESRILERNKKHLAQAEGTPFAEAPLKNMSPANALHDYFDSDTLFRANEVNCDLFSYTAARRNLSRKCRP
jgi:hypothetical protein